MTLRYELVLRGDVASEVCERLESSAQRRGDVGTTVLIVELGDGIDLHELLARVDALGLELLALRQPDGC